MLLSIICIDLSVPWFPAKSLKSDFSQSLAFKTLTIEKDIYPSYFKKKLSGREEEGPGVWRKNRSHLQTPTVALKKLQIIFSEDF